MKRLLVIRFSALGDVAMLAPVVRAAAESYPEWEITMLSQQRLADLFADMPANVVFHGVDLQQQSLHQIVAGLGTFDAVADMHDVWRSRYIRFAMRLRGARVRTIHKGRWDKWRLTHGWLHQPLLHTTERYQKVLKQLHFPTLTRYRLDVDSTSTRFGIGIAPFAAHPGKVYPIEKMERVVAMLSEQKEKIVLFGGGKKEQAILDNWAAQYPNVASVAGRKTLSEELAIMRGLRVIVTMDSANMHLASLAGTRVVSIWGATHPYAGFLGIGQSENDCIQRELPCRPCSIYGKKQCKYGDYRCLDIQPDVIKLKVLSPEGHDYLTKSNLESSSTSDI